MPEEIFQDINGQWCRHCPICQTIMPYANRGQAVVKERKQTVCIACQCPHVDTKQDILDGLTLMKLNCPRCGYIRTRKVFKDFVIVCDKCRCPLAKADMVAQKAGGQSCSISTVIAPSPLCDA